MTPLFLSIFPYPQWGGSSSIKPVFSSILAKLTTSTNNTTLYYYIVILCKKYTLHFLLVSSNATKDPWIRSLLPPATRPRTTWPLLFVTLLSVHCGCWWPGCGDRQECPACWCAQRSSLWWSGCLQERHIYKCKSPPFHIPNFLKSLFSS